LKILLRLLATLLTLTLLTLLFGWFHFDEEHIRLDAGIRAQFDESFIDLSAGTVHYELAGPETGQLVVLVHGFSVPAYLWDPTFDALIRQGFRVLRFDLYGRGHSDRPDVDYTIAFFADQLEQLVNELGIDTPFNLVGLSMGGPIVTLYTNRNPQKVKRLVLVDPVVFAPSEDDIAPMALPLIGEYLAAVYLIPQLAAGQSGDFANKEAYPDWEDRFREQMQYHGFRAAILSTVRNFPAADTLGEYRDLGRKDLPVQLFWGRQDQTIPLEHSEKLMELVPQAQLNIIEDAGHIPHFEQPDAVNPILIEFLSQ
jgi:pimeloyl-ACP methyl ester carboxylesterase